MDEHNFEQQKATIMGMHAKARELRAEADELDRRASEWMLDLMNVAHQEPWFGEAND